MKKSKIIFLQIFILIIAIFANSYLISESFLTKEKNNEIILGKLSSLIFDFFSIKQIGIVSAIDLNNFCCKKTKDGDICKNIYSDSFANAEDECIDELIPTSCENIEECKIGCCVDINNGICTPQSSKNLCNSQEGIWKEDTLCSTIDVCQKACCKLGNTYQFTTENECEKRADALGVEKNFDISITSESECLFLKDSDAKGACVIEDIYEGNKCTIETKENCREIYGNFYENSLCTNPILNTDCTKTENTICLEKGNERGVYFTDSCGNIANIYDANKVNENDYWNEIKKDSEICQVSSSNFDSCGNCKTYAGTICGSSKDAGVAPIYGNYACRNMDCSNAPIRIDNNGNGIEFADKKNGETWCLYDSAIGIEKSPFKNNISADPVGSLHWKASCINGKVEYEMCGDYRTGICTQSELTDPNVKLTFTMANCVINEANLCIGANSESNEKCRDDKKCIEDYMQENCIANPQCRMANIAIADNFKFDVCVPRYPIGFNLKPEELNSEWNKQLCSSASTQCTAVFVKDTWGDWECKQNCGCVNSDNPGDAKPSENFIEKMNDLCISLGDCGSYINYQGKGTENIKVKPETTSNVKSENYVMFKNSIAGKTAESKLNEEILAVLIGIHHTNNVDSTENKDIEKIVGMIEGAGGITQGYLMLINFIDAPLAFGGPLAKGSLVVSNPGATTFSITPFGSALVGAAIGAGIGQLIAGWRGYQGESATYAQFGGAVAGAIISYGMATATTELGAITTALDAFYGYSSVSGVATAAGGTATGVGVGGVALTGYGGLIFNSVGFLGLGPVGWVIVAAMVILTFWGDITGAGETESVTVGFECFPWQAQKNSNDCEKCNDDSLERPCTEYKCNSLGQNCKLVNQDTDNPECISTQDDGIAPMISKGDIFTNGVEFVSEGNEKIKIESDESEKKCISSFTTLIFQLQTDEYAQCKYSFEDSVATNFDAIIGEYPNSQNAFLQNHTFLFDFPSIDFVAQNIGTEFSEDLRKMYSNMRLYVHCQDYWGNYNVAPYIVEFCVAEDDKTAVNPSQIVFTPTSNSYLPFNTTEKVVSMILPEPAECRYSKISGQSYEIMEENMNCNKKSGKSGIGVCITTLKDLAKGENKFYLKCNDSVGNINGEDIEYKLFVAGEKLKIDSIKFNALSIENYFKDNDGRQIIIGNPPIQIDMIAETSGGAQDGMSECYYTFDKAKENNPTIKFFETNSSYHKQSFNQMVGGNFDIYVKCVDVSENFVLGVANIEIKTDSEAPKLIGIYRKGYDITIFTDEESKCTYNNEGCNFFEDKEISNYFSKEHILRMESWKNYYIKCTDSWDNKNSECLVVVKAYKDL